MARPRNDTVAPNQGAIRMKGPVLSLPKGRRWFVWSHAPHHIAPGDVEEALAWFREVTGQKAKAVVVNPRNEVLIRQKAPNYLRIETSPGCLSWELWFSADSINVSTDTDHADNDSTTHNPANQGAYLDIERDMQVVNAGGLFCRACLVGKPAFEPSPDERYCRSCYDFLVEEAARLTGTARPKWLPKAPKARESEKKAIPIPEDGYTNMAHSKITDFQVRHISTLGRRRGPKPKLLPGDRIRELHHDGLGVERIAQELKAEGVNVSPRTVLRVVRGERRQPEEQIPLPIP